MWRWIVHKLVVACRLEAPAARRISHHPDRASQAVPETAPPATTSPARTGFSSK
jgi:hypothetical protein